LLDGNCQHSRFDLLGDVAPNRLPLRNLLKGDLTALVVEFFEAIEAVARVAHLPAGLADIAELLC
jgi:hypothetical protein